MNTELIDKSVILLHAHLSDDIRKQICHDAISSFKTMGYDVIVTTHTPVDKDTQELADYVIYDKDNVLQDEPDLKGMMSYRTENFEVFSKEFFKYNYTFAVHRLLTLGIFHAKILGKKIIHIFDYDCLITNNDELEHNSSWILLHNKKAVVYEWVKEYVVDNVVYSRKQAVSMFISGDVDFLFERYSKFLRLDTFNDVNLKYNIKTTEEYIAYVMGITYHNDLDGNSVEGIIINQFDDIRYRKGYEFAKVHTDEEMPWVCLCDYGDHFILFYKSNNKTHEKYQVKLNSNDYSIDHIPPLMYDVKKFNKNTTDLISIFIGDELFRTYDLSKTETIEYIKKCNIWVEK